jgi:beta-xylosidase
MITPPRTGSVIQPAYDGYFADPFAWRVGEEYFAIGTGEKEAAGEARAGEMIFPLLRSRDLRRWEEAGHALIRPDRKLGRSFWAPEVARGDDGLFYLYYSVGHEDRHHQLRVAVSDSPLGPYRDVGDPLIDPTPGTGCDFAIDAHVFRDTRDGDQCYLFYARDFLDCDNGVRAGTALMVARMESMTRLENEGRPVLRARHDWQRFLKDRPMYGGVYDWHTLEGPSVRAHAGKYYCFYSGGRWENNTYGVDYGVADRVTGPYSDAGNEAGPRVLRSLPGVIGPGHNSIVDTPEGEEFIVFHAWDPAMTARRMFVAPLAWTECGPRALL